MKKRVLLTSITTIILCVSIITGATFALFTDRQDLDVTVTAGNVELTAYYDTTSMQTWSVINGKKSDVRTDHEFDNGGTANFQTNTDPSDGKTVYTSVVIDRMTPGDVAKFMIDVTNLSNVNVQYRVRMISRPIPKNDGTNANYTDLTPALVTTAYIDGFNYALNRNGNEVATEWKYIGTAEEINDIWITIDFPNTDMTLCPPRESYSAETAYEDPITGEKIYNADNFYQNAKAELIFVVEAVQANGVAFEAVENGSDLFANNQFILNGNFNGGNNAGEATTVTIPNTTNGTWGSATIPVAGTTTYSNLVIDASTQNSVGATFFDLDDGVNSTVILSEHTTVVGKENDTVFQSLMGNGESFTLMVDKTSKIVANGADAAAIAAQGWKNDVINLVFNGTASECIQLKNGATGIYLYGNDGQYLTANIYVNSSTDIAQYKAIIDAEGVYVNWYVDGVIYETSRYYH